MSARSAPVGTSSPPRSREAVLSLLVGMASVVVGLSPWLVSGGRLPLQNLGAAGAAPDEMPFVLLPFSQYALTLIVAVIVIGSALAGGIVRVARRRRPGLSATPAVVGVLLIQVAAVT
jgi:hypothetical protein